MRIRLVFAFLVVLGCKTTTVETPDAPVSAPTPENAEAMQSIEVLDVPAYKEAIEMKDVQLVDVRTPKEYDQGHIENAINIDFLATDFKEKILQVSKDRPVYIYCRSGNRSRRASKLMKNLGFTSIIDLKGGYLAWPDK